MKTPLNSSVRFDVAFGLLSAVLAAPGCGDEPVGEPVVDISTQIAALSDGQDTYVFGTFANEPANGARRYPVAAVGVSLDGDEVNAPFERGGVTFLHRFLDRAEGSVEVSFKDADLEEALNVNLELPAAFTLQTDQARVARDEALVVELGDPTADELYYWVDGDCIESSTVQSEDAGELRIEPSAIRALPEAGNVACEVTLTVSRINQHRLHSVFGREGEAIAQQERKLTFVSLPHGG